MAFPQPSTFSRALLSGGAIRVSACVAFALAAGAEEAKHPTGPRRPFCSIITRPWVREEPLAYVVIAARTDTIPATVYRPWVVRLGYPADTRPPDPVPDIVRYGQHASILRAVGLRDSALAARSEAALVEWSTNSMCQAIPPERAYRALSLPAGTVALLAGMPRIDTIAPPGVVVLHLHVGTRFYAPAFERRALRRRWHGLWLRPRVLTIEEYESLLKSLPTDADWENTPVRALETLEAWARANPALARREPARTILRGAREEVEWRASRPGM